VRGERAVPIDRDDVCRSHRLADAAERSFREGAPIRIDAPAPAANAPGPGASPA